MTDELLLAYFDAAEQRLARRASSRFDEAVEAVRIGYLIAVNPKNYTRWKQRRPAQAVARGSHGLSGAALERSILALAASHPDLVAVRT